VKIGIWHNIFANKAPFSSHVFKKENKIITSWLIGTKISVPMEVAVTKCNKCGHAIMSYCIQMLFLGNTIM